MSSVVVVNVSDLVVKKEASVLLPGVLRSVSGRRVEVRTS